MRAVVLPSHGDLDVLRVVHDHPRPQAVTGHVVIRVTASSLNYHDVFTVRGMPGIRIPMPVVVGIDVVGVIEELGEQVAPEWAIGDRVVVLPWSPDLPELGLIGEVYDGGLQEYALIDQRLLIRLPDTVSDVQAAALPVAYGTAHRMIIGKGAIGAGDRVLVLGASGGVGTASVQLAKQLGAHVVAAAGSDEKVAALLELGADEAFNYAEHDIADWVRSHHGKPSRFNPETGMDVIVNFTGGQTWLPTLKSAGLGGRILTCGASAGFDPTEDLRYIWSFELQIIGSNGYGVHEITSLLEDVATGRLDPLVTAVLPLEEAPEGLRRLRDREVIGKIVVDPWQET